MTLGGWLLGDALFGPAFSYSPQPLDQPHNFTETKSIEAAAREERHSLSYLPSIHTRSSYFSQQETSDHIESQ
jgi:hypothetical protein